MMPKIPLESDILLQRNKYVWGLILARAIILRIPGLKTNYFWANIKCVNYAMANLNGGS